MDKVCATCGTQLQPDQGFCENCGAAWKPASQTASTDATQPVQQVAAPARTSSSKTVLIVVIAIVALGIGGWFFLTHRAVASTVTTSTSAPLPSTPLGKPAEPSADKPAATADAAASSRPCSLVTRAEMESILGAKIVKVTTTELTCNYFTDETMSAEVDTTWTGGKDSFAQVKGFNSAPGLFEPVAGIGDEAYMQAAGVLHVLKGDTYVVVNSRVYPNKLETESAIARKAMEKLK